MTARYLTLADFILIATKITGFDEVEVAQTSRLDLADSALAAPAASFGGVEFYPDFVDKAAVLLVRVAKNHALVDGNKRAAWVALRLSIELNDWTWDPYPSIDDAEQAVLAVAAGSWKEQEASDWLRAMLRPPAS